MIELNSMNARQQEKKFKKEYAIELLNIAEGDWYSAQDLLNSSKGRIENLFFLVHQAIEKSVKAYLCWLNQPIPMVHDLGVLVAKIPTHLEFPFDYKLNELNDFATIRRYEEGVVELTKEEAESALRLAEDVQVWVREKVLSKKC